MSNTATPSRPSLDWGLLARNPHFRHVFIARSISLLGLGFLAVAVPLQVFQLSGDSGAVGLAMALEGAGMFFGLLAGGVLADRHDRKRLILLARCACGLGFLGLAVNAWAASILPRPLVLGMVYALAAWDGLFGAIGVTALLAAMPELVGRENLLQARALSMLSMRLATVGSPALGGALIAAWGVAWNYLLAAVATALTLLPLLRLPRMRPQMVDDKHPLRALAEGMRYLIRNKVVAGVVLVGSLVSFTTAVRALFPALSEQAFGGGALKLGLMYSAVPLGAALSAWLSGWAQRVERPGLVLQGLGLAAFACLMALGMNRSFVLALLLLAVFGALVSLAGLLQYALVQGHTPDAYLGRVNGLWSAQDALGDSVGTVAIGLLAQTLSPLGGVAAVGAAGLALGLWALARLPGLREAGAEAASPQA
ncbi:enterobactin transporter EntS [Mitsuaria sp. WAJ17]|uniref:enterobactin transporter EntS n=1 Tax=Mitsuaria sp. WAJ17 TaxID=2761452 RepID=UPI0015FF39AA|nr:enterobactin transporter EntS [Mitsuaria sp. WAJ17]MBB2485940.1 enterobactin transporter EntS [Mitsuaria sp. WAJ17]